MGNVRRASGVDLNPGAAQAACGFDSHLRHHSRWTRDMPSQSEWWSTFYSGIVLDTRMGFYPEEVTRQQTDFLVKTFGPSRPLRVLDVPCGNGRLALELAARGFTVVGADLTAEFVEEARAKAG